MAPATGTPWASKCEALSTISSIGLPTPPSEMMTVGARSIEATRAFDSPTTAPTPAWPVPSISQMSWPAKNRWAARIGPSMSSTMSPPR